MISIIDDDRSIREAVQSLIRSLGYEAAAFSSDDEYLQSVLHREGRKQPCGGFRLL